MDGRVTLINPLRGKKGNSSFGIHTKREPGGAGVGKGGQNYFYFFILSCQRVGAYFFFPYIYGSYFYIGFGRMAMQRGWFFFFFSPAILLVVE